MNWIQGHLKNEEKFTLKVNGADKLKIILIQLQKASKNKVNSKIWTNGMVIQTEGLLQADINPGSFMYQWSMDGSKYEVNLA